MSECLWCRRELTDRQNSRDSKFCSRSCTNRYRYRDVQREYVCQRCGKKYTKKGTGTKKGTRYCSQDCGRKHNLGLKFSDDHKQKIAEAQKTVKVEGTFQCDRCAKPFDSNTALRAHKAHCGHTIVLHRCFNCGKNYKGMAGLQRHQIWCIDSEKNDLSREKVRRSTAVSNIRRIKDGTMQLACRDTKPELELAWRFDRDGIKFERQFSGVVGVNHCYDFLVGSDCIVEVDGDYWHGNPDKFQLSANQKRQYYIDLAYTEKARGSGFKVLRYWESEILQKPDEVIHDIMLVAGGGVAELARRM